MFTNPRLSERHASLFADDRARADYLNWKDIFGQVVCANSCIVAKNYQWIYWISRGALSSLNDCIFGGFLGALLLVEQLEIFLA